MLLDELFGASTPPLTADDELNKTRRPDNLRSKKRAEMEMNDALITLMLDIAEKCTPDGQEKSFQIMKLKHEIDVATQKIMPLSLQNTLDNPDMQNTVSEAHECLSKCVTLLKAFLETHEIPEANI